MPNIQIYEKLERYLFSYQKGTCFGIATCLPRKFYQFDKVG